MDTGPSQQQKVALAYEHQEGSLSLWGGLKKGWEAIESGISWLCGEEELCSKVLEKRQAQSGQQDEWSIKARAGGSHYSEEDAVQHLLIAGAHCEIMPMLPPIEQQW